MLNLDLALREPGRVVLIERRALLARLELPLTEPRSRTRGGLLGAAMRGLGLRREDDDREDEGRQEIDAHRLALPRLPWAEAAESAEGYLLLNGVAILSVTGILTRRGYYDFWNDCWFGGYEAIGATIARARADDRVGAILLLIDSPGGLSDGCFELCDEILAGSARNGGKPIWAHCYMACSAAYGIAASCDRVVAVAEGEVGSIGVYMLHLDASEWLKSEGLKVEAIESGVHKTDGGMWKPLGEDARASFQAVVDQVARRFMATVSGGRALKAEAIIAQEARWYLARHDDPARSGMALGLVDEIATEPAAFAALTESLSQEPEEGAPAPAGTGAATPAARPNSRKEKTMEKQLAALRKKAAAGDEDAKKKVARIEALLGKPKAAAEEDDKPEDETAEAEDGEGEDDDMGEEDGAEDEDGKEPAANATGSAAGFGLLAAAEARGREGLARELGAKVAKGKLTYGEAKKMLAAAPKGGRLSDAMAGRDQNPGVVAGDPKAAEVAAGWDKAVASANALGGVAAKKG